MIRFPGKGELQKNEIHPCPTYRSTGQDSCRRPDRVIVAEQKRLLECTEAFFAIEGRSISEIFGYPDDLKFKSSMTLFAYVADPCSVFSRILDKYFNGERDTLTLQLLEKLKAQP